MECVRNKKLRGRILDYGTSFSTLPYSKSHKVTDIYFCLKMATIYESAVLLLDMHVIIILLKIDCAPNFVLLYFMPISINPKM